MNIIKNRSIGIVKGVITSHRYAREVNPMANEVTLARELTAEIKVEYKLDVADVSKDNSQPLGIKAWKVLVRVGPDAYQNWTYEEI